MVFVLCVKYLEATLALLRIGRIRNTAPARNMVPCRRWMWNDTESKQVEVNVKHTECDQGVEIDGGVFLEAR